MVLFFLVLMSFFILAISSLKFSLSFLSIPITIVLTLYLVDCLYLFNLVIFLEFLFFNLGLFLFTCCCFLIWLPLYAYFYLFGKSAMSPSFGRVDLCSSCPVGLHGAIYLITWAGCSWCVPWVGCVYSHGIVESWLLFACQWVKLILIFTDCEDWPWTQHTSGCVGVDSTDRDLSQWTQVPAKTTLWVCCSWG